MDGIIENAYCTIYKKILPLKIRIVLRVFNILLLVVIYKFFGIDWVIIYGIALVTADIDSLADRMYQKGQEKC